MKRRPPGPIWDHSAMLMTESRLMHAIRILGAVLFTTHCGTCLAQEWTKPGH